MIDSYIPQASMTHETKNEVIDLETARTQRSANFMANSDSRPATAEEQLMLLGEKAREMADRIAKVRAEARALSR